MSEVQDFLLTNGLNKTDLDDLVLFLQCLIYPKDFFRVTKEGKEK